MLCNGQYLPEALISRELGISILAKASKDLRFQIQIVIADTIERWNQRPGEISNTAINAIIPISLDLVVPDISEHSLLQIIPAMNHYICHLITRILIS